MSSVREVDLETGDVLRQKVLAHEDFAEGVTRLNGRSGRTQKFVSGSKKGVSCVHSGCQCKTPAKRHRCMALSSAIRSQCSCAAVAIRHDPV